MRLLRSCHCGLFAVRGSMRAVTLKNSKANQKYICAGGGDAAPTYDGPGDMGIFAAKKGNGSTC